MKLTLVEKAQKIAEFLTGKSTETNENVHTWIAEVSSAYEANPNSKEVKDCQRILDKPVQEYFQRMMPLFQIFLHVTVK